MRINLFLSDCHQAVSQHSSGHSLLKIRPFSTCSKWFSHTVCFYNVHRSSEISYLLLSAKCSGWPGCEPLLSWLGALYLHSHQKAYKSRPGERLRVPATWPFSQDSEWISKFGSLSRTWLRLRAFTNLTSRMIRKFPPDHFTCKALEPEPNIDRVRAFLSASVAEGRVRYL